MHILVVCNKFPFPPRDGGSLASYNMVRGLAETGNKVDLLAMNTSKHFIEISDLIIDIPVTKIKDVYIDNSINYLKFVINFFFSSLPYNAERFISNEFSKELVRMLSETKYDIVQIEGLYLAPYLKIIRDHSMAKIAYRAHNVEHLIWEKHCLREKNKIKRWYLRELYLRIRRFELEFINLYDLLVTITNNDLEFLDSMGNIKPSIVIPFGISSTDFKNHGDEDHGDFCIMYIGALDWRPNIEALDWFIGQVWPLVKEKHPELRFRVAGRNANERYANYLTGLGIDYLGEVESSADFLSGNGIVVVPLFSGSGIRVRIIEAMYSGRPVIATTTAAAGIPVEHGQNILLADEPGDFARHIDKLISDREFAEKLGMNAELFSRGLYDNNSIIQELSSFYKTCLV
jgi:polysaccharide biosynthesis protein PslH